MVHRERAPASAEDRILAYGAGAGPQHATVRPKSDPRPGPGEGRRGAGAAPQPRARAPDPTRLEAAGSALKPAEWLLIHGAIA